MPGSSSAQGAADARPLAIGVWGTFDLDNYGDLLFPRIIRREILRRLPGSIVRIFGPLGYPNPVTFGDVEPPEALGRWTRERRVRLADELDAVIVGGGDLIHGRDSDYAAWYRLKPGEEKELSPSRFFVDGLGSSEEARCPVIWSAVGIPFELVGEFAERVRAALAHRPYGTVRDRVSQRRLETIGARVLKVVPDPAFLLPRIFGEDRLAHRLEYLKARGWFPTQAPAIVVQAHAGYMGHSERLAKAISDLLRARPGTEVVLVETGPCHGDGGFADALQPLLPVRPHRVPPSAGLTAIAAAIAGSVGFIGSSLHGSITAFSYGRPVVVLAGLGSVKLAGFADTIGREDVAVSTAEEIPDAYERARRSTPNGGRLEELQARLDEHFDRVAEVIVNAVTTRDRPPPLQVLELGAALQGATEAVVESIRRAEQETASLAGTILEQSREIDRLGGVSHSLGERLAEEERARAKAEGRSSILRRQLASLQRRVTELETRLREVVGSTAYQVGRRVVRVVGRLAPPGSRRRRVGRRLAELLRVGPAPKDPS